MAVIYPVLLKEALASKVIDKSIAFLRADRRRAKPKVPFIRIGGSVRYRQDDLLALLNPKK